MEAAMAELLIRVARHTDVDQLVELRRDSTFEESAPSEGQTRPDYERDFHAFLDDALDSGRWHIWVAEADERIVAHVFVALVDKVPRPVCENRRIAYLTNVYTLPAFRGQGIGTELIRRAQRAAKEADVELMLVWPSAASIELYERQGFTASNEPLVWEPP
jgi:ribosomal protein S18 acetylase RimI-like enzyme